MPSNSGKRSPTAMRRSLALLMRFAVPVMGVVAAAGGLALDASAQTVTFGLAAGGYANRDFYETIEPDPFPVPGFFPHVTQSDSGGYLIGPAAEVHWSPRVSLRVEALYKPLRYHASASWRDGVLIGFAPAPVITWQFPVLTRYKFPFGRAGLFVEGGPSFRSAGNLNSSDPSHTGVSAGAGLETRWRKLRITPGVRYTRWAGDDTYPLWSGMARTKPDQLEFLAGFGYVPDSAAYPLGRRIALGAVIASTLSGDIRERLGENFHVTPAPPTVVFGPMVEFKLFSGLSLEANALPRSFRSRSLNLSLNRISSGNSGGTWEFPVLVKRRLTKGSARPFVVLGPSFRLPKFDYPIWGVTVGAGVEFALRRVRLAPAARYTRWGPQRNRLPGIDPNRSIVYNQAQVLVGVSF